MMTAGRRIRVQHVIEATTGGGRRHLRDVVFGLDRERFSAAVLCSTLRDQGFLDDVAAMTRRAVDVTTVPMLRAIAPLRDAVALGRIVRHLRRFPCDLVHTHSSKAGVLGRIAARIAGVRAVVHTPHVFAFQMDAAPGLRWVYRQVERLVTPLAQRVVCVSAWEKSDALRAGLGPEERFVVIPNGIDAAATAAAAEQGGVSREALGLTANDLVVGMVARFAPQKGHRYLLDAAPEVLRRAPGTRFLFVGDGELRARVAARIEAEGLGAACRIVTPTGSALPYYPLCDVCVLPSLWEGAPYALLEAMACGLPVLASRVGGVPEIITSGETGMLVAPRDGAALASGLVALLTRPALRVRLGGQASRAVKDAFAVADMVQRLEAVYDDILTQAAEPG